MRRLAGHGAALRPSQCHLAAPAVLRHSAAQGWARRWWGAMAARHARHGVGRLDHATVAQRSGGCLASGCPLALCRHVPQSAAEAGSTARGSGVRWDHFERLQRGRCGEETLAQPKALDSGLQGSQDIVVERTCNWQDVLWCNPRSNPCASLNLMARRRGPQVHVAELHRRRTCSRRHRAPCCCCCRPAAGQYHFGMARGGYRRRGAVRPHGATTSLLELAQNVVASSLRT